MHIIISDTWLKACGRAQLSGVALPAKLIESASWSRMGSCYAVTLPDGHIWTVFHARGVTVV